MLFSVRVLCKQYALFLLIIVGAEKKVLCRKIGNQPAIFNNVLAVPSTRVEKPLEKEVLVENNNPDQPNTYIKINDIEQDEERPKVVGIRTNENKGLPLISHDSEDQQIIEELENVVNSTHKPDNNETNAVESWCVIWYLGAFGSLVCFFLIITCTELFFGNPLYRDNNLNAFVQSIVSAENKPYMPETPPPPYHLFAPPDYYETVQKADSEKRRSLDVFVVPVHTGRFKVDPPPQFEETDSKIIDDQLNTVIVRTGKLNPGE